MRTYRFFRRSCPSRRCASNFAADVALTSNASANSIGWSSSLLVLVLVSNLDLTPGFERFRFAETFPGCFFDFDAVREFLRFVGTFCTRCEILTGGKKNMIVRTCFLELVFVIFAAVFLATFFYIFQEIIICIGVVVFFDI